MISRIVGVPVNRSQGDSGVIAARPCVVPQVQRHRQRGASLRPSDTAGGDDVAITPPHSESGAIRTTARPKSERCVQPLPVVEGIAGLIVVVPVKAVLPTDVV